MTLATVAGLLSVTAARATPEVYGHRGARAARPENTLPAFAYALEAGVDGLELDIGVSRDGRIVVGHDAAIPPTLCLDSRGERVTGWRTLLSMDLSEIRGYDCGTLKNAQFPAQRSIPGTRMPTLDEVFAHVAASPFPAARTVRFDIEIKTVPEHPAWTASPGRFAELLVAAVKKHGLEKRVIVQSFDSRALAEVRALAPELTLAALTDAWLGNSVDIVRRTGADIVSPVWHFVNPEYVRRLHARHVKVVPWTANRPREWDKLIRADVDGIITDDPAALIAYLKERGLRK